MIGVVRLGSGSSQAYISVLISTNEPCSGQNHQGKCRRAAVSEPDPGLSRAYQAFSCYDVAGYRDSGLTPAQVQVIFSPGDTAGMSCRELGELILISKGTLTGVIDRLQAWGLDERISHSQDRRCTLIRRTPEGGEVFAVQFLRQVLYLKQCFDELGKKERKQAIAVLKKLQELFA